LQDKQDISANEVVDTVKKYTLITGPSIVLDVERSHDCYLYDSLSKTEYLDFFTFFATNPIGFNHPAMHEPKFLDRLAKAALVKPNLSRFYTVEIADWVKTFARICGRGYFKHYFFVDGGALAVENALKTAFDWKVRKNIDKGLDPDLQMGIIHFKDAFHGRSGYTLSLTNTADPRKYQYYPKFDWPRITNPKCKFPLTGKNLKDTIGLEKRAFQEIDAIIKMKRDEFAGIIIEPVQCDGGDNHFRPHFFQGLRKICDENELLLIFDEIQTGIGITGKMWAFEHFGVIPDIVCFCKKTQVGGIAATERIDDVDNVFKVPQRIGSTFGGNLVDMVRATRFLEIIENEKLIEHAAHTGTFLVGELQKLALQYPDKIENVRGLGLLVAFDLPSVEERDEFVRRCFDKKLLMVITEPKSIRLRPFLDVKREHIIKMIHLFKEVLDEMREGNSKNRDLRN
jgi:L-lysine 6-transaminase